MTDHRPTVYIVDGDADARQSLEALLRSRDWPCESFATAEEFLSRIQAGSPRCLIAETKLPGLSGLALQREIAARRLALPVIFLSGASEVRTVVEAMRDGAFDFLPKPHQPEELADAVRRALEQSHHHGKRAAERQSLEALLATLSERERQVADLLAQGKTTREIASALDISPKTVDNHRAKVLMKLKLDNVFKLIRLVTLHADPAACQ